MRFHWQNLNEGRRGEPKGWPYHGRAWLHVGRLCFRFSWHFWGQHAGATVDVGGEDGLTLFLGLPPINLWFGVEGLLPRRGFYEHRSTGIRFFDWAIWWSLWENTHSWSRSDPWWQRWNWHPGRTFFGKWIYETRFIEARAITVPMPEGEYAAHAELRYAVRGHRWSPIKHRNYEVEIKLERPIPYSGKGESDYDQGRDGCYAMSCKARSIEDAIGKLVTSCLETRRKRGDPAKWTEAA